MEYLIFAGRVISAKDAFDIGLMDYMSASKEIDEKIASLIKLWNHLSYGRGLFSYRQFKKTEKMENLLHS
jgi:enoyl-CoA hydratase/carnithine racemase